MGFEMFWRYQMPLRLFGGFLYACVSVNPSSCSWSLLFYTFCNDFSMIFNLFHVHYPLQGRLLFKTHMFYHVVIARLSAPLRADVSSVLVEWWQLGCHKGAAASPKDPQWSTWEPSIHQPKSGEKMPGDSIFPASPEMASIPAVKKWISQIYPDIR